MRCLSVFAGAGISDLGFHRAGFECLAQIEIDRAANSVRRRHFPESEHHGDIKEFDAKRFRGVDAVFGGFPCQDYSVAGKRGGIRGDRGALWWDLHRVVGESLPPFIGLENVPGLLSSGAGEDFYWILDSLVELGYSVAWRVLNLRYFGIPQRRRRVLIVGHLGRRRAGEIQLEPGCLSWDFATCPEAGEEDSGDVARCLRGRSNLGQAHAEDLDTYAARPLRSHTPDGNPDQDTFVAFTCKDSGQDAGDESPTLRSMVHAESHANGGGQVAIAFSNRGIDGEDWETLRADCNGALPMIQTGWRVRRLTPRECERLMGLPDDFTRWTDTGIEVKDGPRYKMLGNGWSVPQAEWLAQRIMEVA